jgi:hypothetical protein
VASASLTSAADSPYWAAAAWSTLTVSIGRPDDLLHADIRRAGRYHAGDWRLDPRHLLQHAEVIAVDHDGKIGAHTRDQLVEAQLDRLAELEGIADLCVDATPSSRRIRSSLSSDGSGQSDLGFSTMTLSEMFVGIGSIAASAVPVREKIVSTSGSCAMTFLQRQLHRQRLLQRGRRHAQGPASRDCPRRAWA